MLENLGNNSRAAFRILSQSTSLQRNQALELMAATIISKQEEILNANQLDLLAARESGMPAAMLDRLMLNSLRLYGMAEGLRNIASLPDPIGRVLEENTRPNGLIIKRVSVPLGVIAVIYEARPNVTADSAGLCLKSGNACILRGGKEAIRSNTAIAAALRYALHSIGLPEDCVQLIEDTSRESTLALMEMTGNVDLLIPRGGKGLINSVVENAKVPVLKTGEGVCHIYVDKAADVEMAANVIFNAKCSRPSVCNACECMLIHQDIAKTALPAIARMLEKGHVVIRADARSAAYLPHSQPAEDKDWGYEFLDLIIASRVVNSLDEAVEHIARYGTGHSEAIITENKAAAERFISLVDASAVYHNASTRFTDGGEFGFGAEIGISTQKLHARGPVGLNELTSYKYIVLGSGQTR